ncbi:MAG: ferredoxin, partial [Flavobacteriales bacterium]|nr:ferredoxin [Flavobacteriales bacterium]
PVQEEQAEVSAEVWVETFRCTTCNDCIDQLPAVFKYNSDKQSFVHNPKGGTFGKIVALAEKCPAKCIHPGLPQNSDEPGLDELMKVAAALN